MGIRVILTLLVFTVGLGESLVYADNAELARKTRRIADRIDNLNQELSPNQAQRVDRNLNRIREIIRGGNGGDGRRNIRTLDSGLLQLRIDGQWRGVCDDSFDRNDAMVACRQLGGTYENHQTGMNGGDTGFWLDDLACRGDEQQLTQCRHNGIGNHNCGSTEHVGVFCSGVNPPGGASARISPRGLLEVRISGEWKGVCDDSFDNNDATVACRQMGYQSAVRYETGRTGANSNFGLDDLGCRGTESTLQSCSHNGLNNHNCGNSEWVSVVCQ